MTNSRTTARGLAVLLAGGLVSAAGLTAAAEPTPTPPPSADRALVASAATKALKDGAQDAQAKLGAHDTALLRKAQQEKRQRVTVMVTTKENGTAAAVAQLKSLGAQVGYVNDKLGYVRASVPTARVLKAAGHVSVERMDLEEFIPIPKTTPVDPTGGVGTAYPGPSATTPDANSYMPTRETNAVAYRQKYPTYDGRGVTVGILDSGVDLAHPALATTTTKQRKIVDWFSATSPYEDPSWRFMLTTVTGPTASYRDITWTLPSTGTYQINRFEEAWTAGSLEVAGDVDRDGKKNTSMWGVLYDPVTHNVWVDTDGDHNFKNNTPMQPYKKKFQVGYFGKDKPATAVKERMPFVVSYQEDVDLAPLGGTGKADAVNIGIVTSDHGTHVAGIVAAHKLFGGTMNGAAPGAKIVAGQACAFGPGCSSVALAEGMIEMVANRGVDVVNLSIGGLPALNDANNARAALYDRLIDQYRVQIVISAGNSGPGVNTVGDPSVATNSISVAAGASKYTWAANYGAGAPRTWWPQNYSSRGPREDGGQKPNVIAPGSAISTVPSWEVADGVKEVRYVLPPGYAMFNGTSMAAPQTTGVAALLLSGAKARKQPVTPRLLRETLMSTASFIKGVDAVAQGNGLVNTTKAAAALFAKPGVTTNYTITAPVCSPLSGYLKTPNEGVGIYNRCSPTAGGHALRVSKDYIVKVTRTSGGTTTAANTHKMYWLGNDGTFSAPNTISLPLNKTVPIRIRTTTKTIGLHSAVLVFDSAATKLIDARMSAAVVAAKPLKAATYADGLAGKVGRVSTHSVFVDVPAGTKALQVNLSGLAAKSQVRWIAYTPYGTPVEDTSSLKCYTNFSDAKVCNPTSRSYANPLPGVWEIIVEARRTTPILWNPFKVTAAAQGVTVTPATQTIDSAKVGATIPLSWTVRNDFGPVTLKGVGGPLGSAKKATPTITKGDLQTTTVTVPAGATKLDVAIGNTADPGADLDLYVKDAAGNVVAQSADGDAEESVSIPNPKAGTYTIEVDGYDVREGGSTYDYLDVFYATSLGMLSVSSPSMTLAQGQTAKIDGSLTVKAAAEAGRQLLGEMQVVSTAGAVLGTGQVLISAVTP